MSTTNSPQTPHQMTGGTCCKAHHDEVTTAAYRLYEEHGSKGGRDVNDWLDAEAQVKARHTGMTHGIRPLAKDAVQQARKTS